MKMRLFMAQGYDEIRKIDDRVNEWLEEGQEVKHVESAMCQVGFADHGERHQSYVLTVWYE